MGTPLLWERRLCAPKVHRLKGDRSLCVTVSEGVLSDLHANARKLLAWYLLAQVLLSPPCLRTDICSGWDPMASAANLCTKCN